MRNRPGLLVLLIVLVIATVFFSGCSDDGSSAGNETAVPTTENAVKFVTGDIVGKTATSSDTLILIVKYDSSADKYERALVYKKSDGTYYRMNANTDMLARSTLEKLYPAKVTHVSSLSQVPVVTPTTLTTVPTTTTTTTTTTYAAPTISSIDPSTGQAGTTVTITSITGTHFRTGASVRLSNVTTTTTISGTSVVADSSTNITCYFTIPSTAIAGAWNVTVTNPDGQKATLTNGFTITNATSLAAPTVTGIAPTSGFSGKYIDITNLAGTNLLDVTSVKLRKSGELDISATNVVVVSSTQITCTFNLAGASAGLWDVKATNGDGESDTETGLFTVNPVAGISGTNLTGTAPSYSGTAPLVVAFTDSSVGSPTIWSWTFSDGGSSAAENPPAHVYSTAGTYTVTHTASASSATNTTTITIAVS